MHGNDNPLRICTNIPSTLQVICGPVLNLVNGSCAAFLLGNDVTNEYNRYKSRSAGICAGCLQDCICVDQDQDENCFPGDAQVTASFQTLNMLLNCFPSVIQILVVSASFISL